MSRLADQIERAAEGYERTLRPAWTGDNRDEMLALFNVVAANLPAILQALRDGEKTLSAPPVTVEEVSSSRDHAQTAGFAREGEIVGPWRIWFDPPPIGTRECDWHYQHDDAEPECPSWMHGHCASREACIAEIINTYEERLS